MSHALFNAYAINFTVLIFTLDPEKFILNN